MTQQSLHEEINAILGSAVEGVQLDSCLPDEVLGGISEEMLRGENTQGNGNAEIAEQQEFLVNADAPADDGSGDVNDGHVVNVEEGEEYELDESEEDDEVIDYEGLSDDDEELQEARKALKQSKNERIARARATQPANQGEEVRTDSVYRRFHTILKKLKMEMWKKYLTQMMMNGVAYIQMGVMVIMLLKGKVGFLHTIQEMSIYF